MAHRTTKRKGAKRVAPRKKRPLTCFLSAAAGVNLSTVVKVLKGENIQIVDAIPPSGTEMLSSLRTHLQNSDFVLGVITSEKAASPTLFELGIAVGLGKPVFVIASPDYPLPASLKGFFYCLAKPDDEEALRFNIPLFLNNLYHATPSNIIKAQGSVEHVIPKSLLNAFREPPPQAVHSSAEIENEIVQYLQSTSKMTTVQSKASASDDRVDLVAWIPELRSDFGNPVLFEIKRTVSEHEIDSIKRQLAKYRNITGVKTIVVIYTNKLESRVEFTDHGYVFFVSYAQLKASFRHGNFEELLTYLRNKAAHGEY